MKLDKNLVRIAGLTLATFLKEKGWEPTVVERDPAVRTGLHD